ncbi:hypothetical protein Q9233_012206 [Columba guinea]|nr:hypothetical protein Q9233_012206 [Columba guinea]
MPLRAPPSKQGLQFPRGPAPGPPAGRQQEPLRQAATGKREFSENVYTVFAEKAPLPPRPGSAAPLPTDRTEPQPKPGSALTAHAHSEQRLRLVPALARVRDPPSPDRANQSAEQPHAALAHTPRQKRNTSFSGLASAPHRGRNESFALWLLQERLQLSVCLPCQLLERLLNSFALKHRNNFLRTFYWICD